MLRMLSVATASVAALVFAGTVAASPDVRTIEYTLGDTRFESLLIGAEDGRKRPALLMVPNWLGISDAAIARAKALAGERYVVLLADMYGAEVRPADFDAAGKASSSVLADRSVARARANRALEALKAVEGVDHRRVAAIGFCFGGTVALELARSGADVAGVISLHGNPGPVLPAAESGITASVLVLHGADDAFVPAENLRAFEAEMSVAGADWSLVSFGGAKHCFAEPQADNRPPGCVYHPVAARRADAIVDQHLAEWFSR